MNFVKCVSCCRFQLTDYLISIDEYGETKECDIKSMGRLQRPDPDDPTEVKHAFQRNQKNVFCNKWLKTCGGDQELPNLSSLKIGKAMKSSYLFRILLYMSSSFWLFGVESRDFSQAQKERTDFKAEQIHKMTIIFTQNDNLRPF